MLESTTVSLSIAKPWKEVYESIWRPETFSQWASGLSESSLERDGDRWKAIGPTGAVRIRFTDHNSFGVMDHYVDTGQGPQIYVPLRVVANSEGTEVLLTVFRQPAMSQEQFRADIQTVRRDLQALGTLLTK
jgi:hypothetical protein